MIESFKIDHLVLEEGLYLSILDNNGKDCICTYDIRLVAPNKHQPVDSDALHTIEHLGATFLRESKWKNDVVYFGPMGCRTGCYLVMRSTLTSEEMWPVVEKMCRHILDFEGEIPGATAQCCGNHLEHNLEKAKKCIANYLEKMRTGPNFVYP